MTEDLDLPGTVRVVLVDANVLYSRVLRDYLLYAAEYPAQMLAVHTTSVARLRGATDASTIAALQRAGAPIAAARMVPLLESAGIALD